MEQLLRNKYFVGFLALAAVGVGVYNWMFFLGDSSGRRRARPWEVAKVAGPSQPPGNAFPLYDAYIVVGEAGGSEALLGAVKGARKSRNPFLTPEEERGFRAGGRTASIVARRPVEEPIKVHGVLIERGRRVAIVNGRAVTVGDRVGNERVLAIEPDQLVLERNGRRRTVPIHRRGDLRIQIGPAAPGPAGGPP